MIEQHIGESRQVVAASSATHPRGPAGRVRTYTRAVSASEALAQHLRRPLARGHTPPDAFTGAAGGAACGDLVRLSVQVDPNSPDALITDAGFDASGCGVAIAAGSAAVGLVRDEPLLSAARIGADEIAEELGGLSLAKRHAAELAADALAARWARLRGSARRLRRSRSARWSR